ncbi:hypothetical protein KFE25_004821 [Diacronema lutheri]|uniref:Steroid 5-alpha reductase C-terminal domain-containing protein n=1 Tax=Diacronema lutheri TaxID=2081491 RepID=A0A8J6CB43_DIALT|nr:hypothetical protein KFE25_004821 [Diacronema lutheri]
MSAADVRYDARWQRSVRCVMRAYALTAVLSAALGTLLHFRGGHPVAVALAADGFATLVVFAFSLEHGNTSLYDPYWHLAPPVILAYWLYARVSVGPMRASAWARCVAMSAVLGCWCLRLTYNWLRGWRGLEHEDWRYVKLRRAVRARGWPDAAYWFGLSLVGYHLVPTAVVFFAMLPMAVAVAGCSAPPAAGGALDALALVVGLGSVAVQAIADEQLRAYRRARAASPNDARFQSGVIDTGLWRYSRHPNYAGEIGHWSSFVLFALGAGAGRECALALAGWLPMVALFAFVSVPLMEAEQAAAKPAYRSYQREVSMLLPLPRGAPASAE